MSEHTGSGEVRSTAAEVLAQAVSVARGAKEDAAALGGDGDLPLWLTLFREGLPVVVITATDDRVETLMIAASLAPRLAFADAAAWVAESWRIDADAAPINPDTGAVWSAGDAGRYVEAHGPGEMVAEEITVVVVDVDGGLEGAGLQVRREGSSVVWGEVDRMTMDAHGTTLDALRRGVSYDRPAYLAKLEGVVADGSVSMGWALFRSDFALRSTLPAILAVRVDVIASPGDPERVALLEEAKAQHVGHGGSLEDLA